MNGRIEYMMKYLFNRYNNRFCLNSFKLQLPSLGMHLSFSFRFGIFEILAEA